MKKLKEKIKNIPWKKWLNDLLNSIRKWLSCGSVLVFLFIAIDAIAVDQIEGEIIVTNTPAHGDFVAINSSTNTWVTNIVSASTEILIGGDVPSSGTNFFLHYAQHPPPSNNVYVTRATNGARFFAQAGSDLKLLLSPDWGQISNFKTNNVSTAWTVRVPLSAEPSAAQATNVSSLLVSSINTFSNQKFSTNVLPPLATSSNLVTLIGNNVTNLNITHLILQGATNHISSLSTSEFFFAASPGSGVTNVLSYPGSAVSLVGATNQPTLNIKGLISSADIAFTSTDATNVTALIQSAAVDDLQLRNSSARSVIGRSAATSGSPGDIVGAGANTYLNDNGSTLAFRSILIDTITEDLNLTGVLTPAQITANQNDYNPSGNSTASILRLDSDAARSITGMGGGSSGLTKFIYNFGSFNITLENQDTGSSAANRFAFTGDLVLVPDAAALIQYDATTSRWRLVGSSQGVGDDLGNHTATQNLNMNGFSITGASNVIASATITGVVIRAGTGFSGTVTNAQLFISGGIITNGVSLAEPAGGGGSPGGSNTEVQFNNSSSFGGDALFTWNNTTKSLTTSNFTANGTGTFNSPMAAQNTVWMRGTSGFIWDRSGTKHTWEYGGGLSDTGTLDMNMTFGGGGAANAIRFGKNGSPTRFLINDSSIQSAADHTFTKLATFNTNATFNGVQTTFNGLISVENTSQNPVSNGHVRRNGTDVLIYSDGSVKNLTTSPLIARKVSDESVTNSSALQDDDALTFAVASGQTWQFEFTAFCTTDVIPGIKFAVNGPTASSVAYNVQIYNTTALANSGFATSYDTAVAASFSSTDTLAIVRGSVITTAGGSITLRWAQETSNATAATVKTGSYVIAHQVP